MSILQKNNFEQMRISAKTNIEEMKIQIYPMDYEEFCDAKGTIKPNSK